MYQSLIVALSVVTIVIGDDLHCVWRNVCYTDPDTGYSFNCPYEGPGEPINDEEAQRILLNRCPDIFTNCKRL